MRIKENETMRKIIMKLMEKDRKKEIRRNDREERSFQIFSENL